MTGHSVTSSDDSSDEDYDRSFYRRLWSFMAPTFFILGAVLGTMYVLAVFAYISTMHPLQNLEYPCRSALINTGKTFAMMKKLTENQLNETAENESNAIAINLILDELKRIEINYNTRSSNSFEYYERYDVNGCTRDESALIVCYRNYRYVVAKISTSINDARNILLHCRFDTSSLEAKNSKDNIAGCAVMFVVMEELSKEENPLNRNVIFFFNVGKGFDVLDSRKFIKEQIEPNEGYMHDAINLNNYDSDGWTMLYLFSNVNSVKFYNSCQVSPKLNVIVEDLYKFGLIHASADYTILNNDFEHSQIDHSNPISIADADSLLLNLIRKSEYVNISLKTANIVYFDVFGMFVINVDVPTFSIIGYAISAASFFSVLLASRIMHPEVAILGKFLISLTIVTCSFCLAVLTLTTISQLANIFHLNMLWYDNELLIIFLYVLPAFVAINIPYVLYDCLTSNLRKKRSEVVMFIMAVQSLWTLMLLCSLIVGIRSSSYLLAIALIPGIASNLLWGGSIVCCRRISVCLWIITFQSVYTLSFGVYLVHAGSIAYTFLISASGRSGPTVDTELIIGLITVLICLLMYCYYAPLIVLLRKPVQLVYIFTLLLIVAGIVVGYSLKINPFNSNDRQNKFHIMHVERKLGHYYTHVRSVYQDYIIYPRNRRGAIILNQLFATNGINSVSDSCSYNIYCGVPGPHQRYAYRLAAIDSPAVKRPTLTYRIFPSDQPTKKCEDYASEIETVPVICDDISTDVKSNYFVSTNISFVYEGTADRVTFAISPDKQIVVTEWNLIQEKPIAYIPWNERQVYYIIYQSGDFGEKIFSFEITVQMPKNYKGQLLKFSMTSEFTNSSIFTTNFRQFLNTFPNWTDVTAWNAIYEDDEISIR